MWDWIMGILSGWTVELVYLALGIGGLVYSLFSIALGGDHDGDGGDHDLAHDGGEGYAEAHGADHGPSPFSLRIVAMFATGFGSIGYLVQHYNPSKPLFSAMCGTIGGLALGGFGFLFLKIFYGQQATSVITASDLQGASGTVVTSIPRDGIGEVSLTARGALVTKPARSDSGVPVPTGSAVEVVRVVGDTLIVKKG